MITFRAERRIYEIRQIMIKYNRQDLAYLLLKYPLWLPKDGEAIWCRADNCYNPNTDGPHTIPNPVFDLMKSNRYVGAWGQKYYKSFDTALITYFKALKKYIRTDKI